MNLMICMEGGAEDLSYVPQIVELGAGIELGSYGLVGIRSEHDWAARLALHELVREHFSGMLALHGPFIGMEFGHEDHLIRAAVQRRMDMTFAVARKLRAIRVNMHTGDKMENYLFGLQASWLKRSTEYWQHEIGRWAEAGIGIVLENDFQGSPDVMVSLVEAVGNPFLGLCLDVGHQHAFSKLSLPEWVEKMHKHLWHAHIHDNDGSADQHLRMGAGTIDFRSFFAAMEDCAPKATLSLEVNDSADVKVADLRTLAERFAR